MRVILLQDVPSLGKRDQVVNVSDGHARNFLFPQNLAAPATAEAMHQKAEREQTAERKTHRLMSKMGELAAELDGHELTFTEKVSETGHLYGAITNKTVVKALRAQGFDVDEFMIQVKEPIKEPGEYQVHLEFPHGFEADVRVVVVSSS